jgi:bifunctional DNA-binding transcriptional regulator/antitoxin component of YhaV-PrlF toxin-antitoxin module
MLPSVSDESADSESEVSKNQANIPARIRRELGIDDGGELRWRVEDEGTLCGVVQRRSGTLDDFDGHDGGQTTANESDRDTWDVDPE